MRDNKIVSQCCLRKNIKGKTMPGTSPDSSTSSNLSESNEWKNLEAFSEKKRALMNNDIKKIPGKILQIHHLSDSSNPSNIISVRSWILQHQKQDALNEMQAQLKLSPISEQRKCFIKYYTEWFSVACAAHKPTGIITSLITYTSPIGRPSLIGKGSFESSRLTKTEALLLDLNKKLNNGKDDGFIQVMHALSQRLLQLYAESGQLNSFIIEQITSAKRHEKPLYVGLMNLNENLKRQAKLEGSANLQDTIELTEFAMPIIKLSKEIDSKLNQTLGKALKNIVYYCFWNRIDLKMSFWIAVKKCTQSLWTSEPSDKSKKVLNNKIVELQKLIAEIKKVAFDAEISNSMGFYNAINQWERRTNNSNEVNSQLMKTHRTTTFFPVLQQPTATTSMLEKIKTLLLNQAVKNKEITTQERDNIISEKQNSCFTSTLRA